MVHVTGIKADDRSTTTDKPKWDINIWNDEKETAATNAVVVKL